MARNLIQCKPYVLKNMIQHYAWGSTGQDAIIATLLEIDPEPGKPYAELWMGAHPNAPSEVELDGHWISLHRLVGQYPTAILGETLSQRFEGRWPFLFKVLSADEPLSIQIHPNKIQAERLHGADPEHYPDDNHKPEIAIALDHLTALVGFRDLVSILNVIEFHQEIAEFIGLETVRKVKQEERRSPMEQGQGVRTLYETMLNRWQEDSTSYDRACHHMAERLRQSSDASSEYEQLFLDMIVKYPQGDIGLFSIFFLNLIHLEAGQGIFLKPGVPHAYVHGNIMECMANSDNVVRLGLTPKFKDVPTLLEILSYDTESIPIIEGNPSAETMVYEAEAKEFRVKRLTLQSGQKRELDFSDGPEIIFISNGQMKLSWTFDHGEDRLKGRRGQSFLIPACLNKVKVDSEEGCEFFMVDVPAL